MKRVADDNAVYELVTLLGAVQELQKEIDTFAAILEPDEILLHQKIQTSIFRALRHIEDATTVLHQAEAAILKRKKT